MPNLGELSGGVGGTFGRLTLFCLGWGRRRVPLRPSVSAATGELYFWEGEIGTVVPLLTKAAAAPWRPSHAETDPYSTCTFQRNTFTDPGSTPKKVGMLHIQSLPWW